MPAPASPSNGKTALIIGASRGIGLGLAQELAGRGWTVIATKRSDAPDLAAAIAESDGRIEAEEVDIDIVESVDHLVHRMVGRSLDLALINAGVSGPRHSSLDTVTRDELASLMLTNAIAPVRLAQRLLSSVADGGTVAFMTSRLGSVTDNTSGGMDLYRASKAALNSLTRGFAAAVPHNRHIAVLNLHPGWVRTAMGGGNASLSVEESAQGLADVVTAKHEGGQAFLDYQGKPIPW